MLREDFLGNMMSTLRHDDSNENDGFKRVPGKEKITYKSLIASDNRIFRKLKETHYEKNTVELEKNVGT